MDNKEEEKVEAMFVDMDKYLNSPAGHGFRASAHTRFKPGPVFVERPIRRIGALFDKLPQAEKAIAMHLKQQAHKLPSWQIQRAFHRLEGIAKYANYE